MKCIAALAKSRVCYNKNRTLLTVIAITFTTILLMALGTCTVGLTDMERQLAEYFGNQHAVFSDLTEEQLTLLFNHMDVEAVETSEFFASVKYDKMNGALQYHCTEKGEISHGVGNLTEGHQAQAPDEICGPKAFFEHMDVEPIIGNTITISFRPGKDKAMETKTFTICGLISQADISKLDVNDTRIAYSAYISEDLLKEYISQEERRYRANIRVNGQDSLNYDELRERIQSVAEDIGYDTEKIDYNSQYLITTMDPGAEMAGIVLGLGTMIVAFSGLVIYSIYYVSVITDVQEIGKLKALGAAKKQIKQLLLREGMTVTLIALPLGLTAGFLLPYFILPIFIEHALDTSIHHFEITSIHMFSLPVMLAVILVVLLTVYISLLKPMRMASRISPIEAIRYQESSTDKRSRRKGYDTVSVTRLCIANLSRNRKRTIVTMITMGLSCVLFMSIAGLMSSMDPEDYARRAVETGDFHIQLDFSQNDKVYPEENLDSLQMENLFDETLLKTIRRIDGVTGIQTGETVLAGADMESELFQNEDRTTLSPMNRKDAETYRKDLKQGTIDYDRMIAENGALFTADYFIEDYGLAVGDTLLLTIYDGDRQLSLNVQLTASTDLGNSSMLLIPREVWERLDLKYSAVTDLYISVEEPSYDTAKEAIQQIVDENPHFLLYSIDEERRIGVMSVSMIKYPMYAILLIISVIGFINLSNTMITSIVTRKRELGILQAIGLSDRQLVKMLAGEGMFFIIGTLLLSGTLGNYLGYLLFLWGKKTHFMSVSAYHYPVWETIGLTAVLVTGQLFITLFISKRVHRESLVERIRSNE